jgi:hypothetical protein
MLNMGIPNTTENSRLQQMPNNFKPEKKSESILSIRLLPIYSALFRPN